MVQAFFIGVVFGGLTYRLRLLTLFGAIAAGGFAFTLLGFTGPSWYVPGITFFVLASGFSKVGSGRKKVLEDRVQKGAVRDVVQVLSNGGIAWGMLLCYLIVSPLPLFYWGYLGAFAAAAADTWATELGTLSPETPRLITSGERVAPGTSGGITIVGSLAALLGAASVGLAAFLAWIIDPVAPSDRGLIVIFVVVSGMLASFVDSLLGATVQVRYRNPVTGFLTELKGTLRPHERVTGWLWVNNDTVNLICTLVGAFFAMVLSALLPS